jgi:hypothetical protein
MDDRETPESLPSPAATTAPSPAATPLPDPPAAAPVVVRPDVAIEEPPVIPEPEADSEGSPEETTRARVVAGDWELTNRVVSTDYDGFRGLNLGYRVTLRQVGSRISGSGVKVSENGAPTGNRTPITVSGRIEGSSIVLTFTERGASRTSNGTFRWQLSEDGTSLRGSFWSDAANTNGPSSARRVR